MPNPNISGRCMYIWKLGRIITVEQSVKRIVQKARRAQLSAVWVKIADGNSRYSNIKGTTGHQFRSLIDRMHAEDIAVWGWHVPRCKTTDRAEQEANLVAEIASEFDLDGVLMDAESGSQFFQGGPEEAAVYASRLRQQMDESGRGLAISSHDIPTNFPDFPFEEFASHAHYNAPQVYYGGSSSVENRLDRAIQANADISAPMIPVGAAWIGQGDGGCTSASACAERARQFMHLSGVHHFEGYSFWHWEGAPMKFWEVLFEGTFVA